MNLLVSSLVRINSVAVYVYEIVFEWLAEELWSGPRAQIKVWLCFLLAVLR